jgi:hypothetical protein
MKNKVLLLILFVISSCSSMTVHEYCTVPENAAKYKDYDQCYEVAQRTGANLSVGTKMRMGLGKTLQGAGQGLQDASKNNKNVHCNSSTDAYGNTTTNCY